jgi:D-arginine dehydrogenase
MGDLPSSCEILIVGGGIAGASAAYEMARAGADVVLVEREPQPGYYTTGRSAATYLESYGNAAIRAITGSSRIFFKNPPDDFSDNALLAPRGCLIVAAENDVAALDEELKDPVNAGLLTSVTQAEALELSPILKPEVVARGNYDASARDIDVDALLQGFLRGFRTAEGKLVTDAQVMDLHHRDGAWTVQTRAGSMSAETVVNAAGAWADQLAIMAGAQPVQLLPKRRTAVTIDPGEPATDWPLTADVAETWYFRPEGGALLISPADETLSPPCDAQPDEMDVATAADRIERVTRLKITRLASTRAGLRRFVEDKTPVVGYSDDVEGFFWLAGQGGYGIQTSPAMARIAASLVAGGELSGDVAANGLCADDLSPRRITS